MCFTESRYLIPIFFEYINPLISHFYGCGDITIENASGKIIAKPEHPKDQQAIFIMLANERLTLDLINNKIY